MRRTFIACVCALVSLALTWSSAAIAQTWPTARTIRIIVPFPPGGAADVTARLVAEHLARELRQTVTVENQGGAGGNIGAATAARAAPDGYTLLITGDPIGISPHLGPVNYDPLKDLAPIIMMTRQPILLTVHPSLGVTSLPEFIATLRTRAGQTYGTAGAGTGQNVLAEWFARQAGIELTHVAYRGGAAAVNDLLGGHIRIGFIGSTPIIPHHASGALRAIAQSTAQRSRALPGVPTFAESGFPDLVLDQWLAAFAPVGTPTEIIERLNQEIGRALASPAVVATLAQLAMDPVGGTPDALGTILRGDFERYGRLVRELRIQAQN